MCALPYEKRPEASPPLSHLLNVHAAEALGKLLRRLEAPNVEKPSLRIPTFTTSWLNRFASACAKYASMWRSERNSPVPELFDTVFWIASGVGAMSCSPNALRLR